MDNATHRLIAEIYGSVTDPSGWIRVCDGLSEIFGGSIVTLEGVLVDPRAPDRLPGFHVHAFGLDGENLAEVTRLLLEETPWTNRSLETQTERFGRWNEDFEHIELETLALYQDWMKPRDMAAVWPCTRVFRNDAGELIGDITIFRRRGQGEFTDADFERVEVFMPHLRRAIGMYRELHSVEREQIALGDAVDRLATGMLLIDSERRVVMQNQAASRILEADDGLRIDRSGPSTWDANDNVKLQEVIARVLRDEAGDRDTPNVLRIKRPSGKQDYTLSASPLLDAPRQPHANDAVAVIFVVDAESHPATSAEVLEDLYDLTHAEAEIVLLIAAGLTVEQAAKQRGVSINTARSHLKHAFAKTGTARQSELLRLIVSGVGSMGNQTQ